MIVLALGLLASSVGAQNGRPDPDGLPWPTRLGARVVMVEMAVRVVDRVVLVPDAATYLDELARWTPSERWPVLIEDARLAPMFIRRFRPAQVLRRDTVGAIPASAEALQRACESVVVSAWGGDPLVHDPADVFRQQRYEPPGVVLTSVNDPAWTAAVALAAGRAQPIAWFDTDYRRPDHVMPEEEARRLISQTTTLVDAAGYPYAELGDAIETITMCRSIAGRVRGNPLPASQFTLADADTSGPVAMTDVLGRHPDGRRFAFAGWIFGTQTQAAYMAMCSLFLPRSRVFMFNTYGDNGHWGAYAIDGAGGLLREQGFDVRSRSGARAGVLGWFRLLPGGLDTDLMLLNSQGMADYFDLRGERGFAQDVPVLDTPLALHMIHSWSLRSPEALATVGGQWLRHGVYAYAGSVQEPFLTAFVTPNLLTLRLVSHVPLLISARQWEGPLSGPWRVQTIGDPLMICPPPTSTIMPERVEPAPHQGTDLSELAKELMRRTQEVGDAEELAEAIRVVSLLGRDDVALQLWTLATQRGDQAACAAAALPTLFRTRQLDAFLEAWSHVRAPDGLDRDMLWQLAGPRLGPSTDEQTLLALRDSMRRPRLHVDLERLAPHLRRAFGQGFVRGVIQRELERTRSPIEREALRKLVRRY